MEIAFGSRKLQKLCNSEKEMRAKNGDRLAKVLQLRLTQMAAAPTQKSSVSRTASCGSRATVNGLKPTSRIGAANAPKPVACRPKALAGIRARSAGEASHY